MMSNEINSTRDRTGSEKAPRTIKRQVFVRFEKELERIEPFKEILREPL